MRVLRAHDRSLCGGENQWAGLVGMGRDAGFFDSGWVRDSMPLKFRRATSS